MNAKWLSRRFWIVSTTLTTVLLATICFLHRSQILFWRIVNKPTDYVKTATIPAKRGKIFDVDGNVIATNKTMYDLYMDCCVVEDPMVWEEKSRRLSQEIAQIIPDRTALEWWSYFQNARKNRKRYIPIITNVRHSMIDSLSHLTLFNEGKYKGGRIIRSKEVREYPYSNLARRTIGVLSSYNQDCFFGIEKHFNNELSGENGYRNFKVGVRKGRRYQWETSYTEETDGWDIYTTLDMTKQSIADSILRYTVTGNNDIVGGCLALMEVKTGAIEALVNIHSLPDGSVGEYFNYMLDYNYEPGDVAQTMTLAAALSDGLITSLNDNIPTNHGILSKTSDIRDKYIIKYERKTQSDSIRIIEGFSSSSWYVASSLAMKYEESPDYYYQWYKTFCIGRHDFDILMNDMHLAHPLERDFNTIISMGKGYGFTVCPMQILAFYNMIANAGKLMKPMLVKKMESDKYGTRHSVPKSLAENVIRKDVADSVKKALRTCIERKTGKVTKGSLLKIAGKSGTTCQDTDGGRQYASTFVGFYPTEEPQYTTICVLFTKPTNELFFGGNHTIETTWQFVEAIEHLR